MSKFKEFPIIDSHIHLRSHSEKIEKIMSDYDRLGVERACMLSICNPSDAKQNENAQALWYKHLYPERLHIFPGCEYFFTRNSGSDSALNLEQQVQTYAAIGIDGWKLLESKPGYHKEPLNSAFYEPLFSSLNALKLPVVWHVGDPIEFWDRKSLPAWAMPDWSYDSSYPTLESLRAEALDVIARYKDCCFILAHFFFLGFDLNRARALLNDFSNVYFDLAPGVEMFFGFSQNPDATHQFFTDFSDRILFGTDRGVADMPAAPRADMIRTFLETDESFDPPHSDIVMWPDTRAPIKGIALGEDALRRIYYDNFNNVVGDSPSKFDDTLAKKELLRMTTLAGPESPAAVLLSKWNES